MENFVTLVNVSFLITIFFGCLMGCRESLSRTSLADGFGTPDLPRLIMAAHKRATTKERKNRTVELLSWLAIIGAVVCYI
ncbi:hypothetical protein [Phyllobacterium sp. K27]